MGHRTIPGTRERAGAGYRFLITLAAALALAAAGCGTAGTPQSTPATVSGPAPTATGSVPSGTPAGTLRVLAEPEAGIGPIYQLINGAHFAVDLSIYELADLTAEADLAGDAARGVNVRVILDQHLEKARNLAAYNYLAAHRVHVRWGPADVTYHQKTLTVDNATSAILTLNLVAADYLGTRDFAVIDTVRPDVAAIVVTFDADYVGRAINAPDGADLVWSPGNAEAANLSVINGARHTLAVENEEMADPAVTAALAADARRGVDVTITMTADPEWDQAFAQLARAGAHIRLYADTSGVLYIHAKAIAADAGLPDQEAVAESQNFSVASFDYDRELGIRTSDPAAVAVISATLTRDHAGGEPYSPGAAWPGPAQASGAWCTATASVYNAAKNENDVYVHSNQPHQSATAAAGRYSHTYQTNGSGYALIYLNGPPPGARITVTVGGATCTTSD
jgi:hypothetical protein